MIVVDGRTDLEKLKELLAEPEQDSLDFKGELDLQSERHRLDFVKDVVSMSNIPQGGYLLFGVDDDQHPCQEVGSYPDRTGTDSAKLSDIVGKYVDGEVIVIGQWYEDDGHEMLLVNVRGREDGLPLPFTEDGKYQNDKHHECFVFRKGQIYIREGASNALLKHSNWTRVLASHDHRIREESRADVDRVLRTLATTLGQGREMASTPLLMEMPLDAFADAVGANLTSSTPLAVTRFTHDAENALVAGGNAFIPALDRMTIAALQCLYSDMDDLASSIVDSLFTAFSGLGPSDAQARLDIVTRVYILGSMAVRCGSWTFLHDLVLRPISSPGFPDYILSSWIRQGQVEASRAGLLDDVEDSGLMISLARELMVDQPAFRPDVKDTMISSSGDPGPDDVLLNTLAQFDLIYCLLVLAEGSHLKNCYPASSALDQQRVEPIANRIAGGQDARKELFPTSSDEDVAAAFVECWRMAESQNMQIGRTWWGLPGPVEAFAEHAGNEGRPSAS